jgi:hypothetical protein
MSNKQYVNYTRTRMRKYVCQITKGLICPELRPSELYEEFEDTKGLITICKSKDRQHNG